MSLLRSPPSWPLPLPLLPRGPIQVHVCAMRVPHCKAVVPPTAVDMSSLTAVEPARLGRERFKKRLRRFPLRAHRPERLAKAGQVFVIGR